MKRIVKIAKLLLGLLGFYFLSTMLLKSYNNSDFAEPIQAVVREKNIDPSAFFYTDNLYIDTTEVDLTRARHFSR